MYANVHSLLEVEEGRTGDEERDQRHAVAHQVDDEGVILVVLFNVVVVSRLDHFAQAVVALLVPVAV